MKRLSGSGWGILGGMFGLGLLLPASAAEPAAVFRFGAAELYSQLTNRFEIPNPGPQALPIQSVTPSCECIGILAWPMNVAAGATGAVDILFVPDKVGGGGLPRVCQTSLSGADGDRICHPRDGDDRAAGPQRA